MWFFKMSDENNFLIGFEGFGFWPLCLWSFDHPTLTDPPATYTERIFYFLSSNSSNDPLYTDLLQLTSFTPIFTPHRILSAPDVPIWLRRP